MANTVITESVRFASPIEELKVVNEAIENVLVGGQSYKIGSRSLTRADLGLLYKRQRELQAELSGDATSPLFGDTVVAIFDRR